MLWRVDGGPSWREQVATCVRERLSTIRAESGRTPIHIERETGTTRQMIAQIAEGNIRNANSLDEVLGAIGLRLIATCVPLDSPDTLPVGESAAMSSPYEPKHPLRLALAQYAETIPDDRLLDAVTYLEELRRGLPDPSPGDTPAG